MSGFQNVAVAVLTGFPYKKMGQKRAAAITS